MITYKAYCYKRDYYKRFDKPYMGMDNISSLSTYSSYSFDYDKMRNALLQVQALLRPRMSLIECLSPYDRIPGSSLFPRPAFIIENICRNI
jgi:hypothetical protein